MRLCILMHLIQLNILYEKVRNHTSWKITNSEDIQLSLWTNGFLWLVIFYKNLYAIFFNAHNNAYSILLKK